jgi:integrase
LDLGWVAGKRKRRIVYGKTQREVQLALADIRRKHAAGIQVDKDAQTVEEFVKRWLTWKEAHVRPRTGHTYRGYMEGHVCKDIGAKRLTRLRVDDVQAMLNAKAGTMTPRSVQALRDILRAALNDAIRWGELERNVAAHARPPAQTRKPVDALTNTQAQALMAAMDDGVFGCLFRLALASGLRRSELCGLRWVDVDLDHGRLRVAQGLHRSPGAGLTVEEPKTEHSRRNVALSQTGKDALRARKKGQAAEHLLAANLWTDTGYIFTDPWGKPVDPDRVTHEFKKVAAVAGVPKMNLHQLRHGAATLMLTQGVPLKVVQETLGHSTLGITADIYSHVAPEVQRQAADAIDAALAKPAATPVATQPNGPDNGSSGNPCKPPKAGEGTRTPTG